MRRLFVVLSGLLLGASLSVLLGACGGYFECVTVDHRLSEGTYLQAGSRTFMVLINEDRSVVVTYADEGGDEVRATYTLGPVRRTPEAH
jgi:hypothetical protein